MAKIKDLNVTAEDFTEQGKEFTLKKQNCLKLDSDRNNYTFEYNAEKKLIITCGGKSVTVTNPAKVKYVKALVEGEETLFNTIGDNLVDNLNEILYNRKKKAYVGTAYNDNFASTEKNETIVLGKGENTLTYNTNKIGTDIIKLTKGETLNITGSAFNDIYLFEQGSTKKTKNDLVIKFNNNNQVTIKNYYGKETGANVLINGENLKETRKITHELKDGEKSYSGSALADIITAKNMTSPTKTKRGVEYGVTLNGGNGNDSITGSKFIDVIKGGLGNDTITGGAGDDKLYGIKGNNTFIFSAGAGNDTVYSGTGEDSLYFNGNVNVSANPADNKKDLVIKYSDSDSVTIKDYYKVKKGNITGVNPKNTFKYIQAGDSKFEIDDIIGQQIIIGGNGTNGDDLIIAQQITETINPGNGNDTIYGGPKTTVYQLRNTTGNKTVYVSDQPDGLSNWYYTGNGNDTIYGAPNKSTNVVLSLGGGDDPQNLGDNTFCFRGSGAGLTIYKKGAYEETVFTRQGNDLTYRYGNTSFTIKDYYTLSDADKQKFYMHAYDYSGNIKYIGGKADFATIIEDKGGLATYIVGTAGADSIAGSTGNDYIKPLAGNDTISLNGGDDILLEGEGNKKIDAVSGNNVIKLGSGDNTVKLGTGSDYILSGSGNNSFEFISTDETADTYNYGGGNDAITFKNHELSNLLVDKTGSNIVIRNKANDDAILTVNNYSNPTHTLNFKGSNDTDATVIDNINTKLGSSTSTKAQTLTTGAGNDIIYAGKKDDTINAGTGENKIYFTKETVGNNNIYTYTGGTDTFILPDTLADDFSTVVLQKDGKDLNVAYNADFANNTVKIKDFYNNEGNPVATIKDNITFKIGESAKTLSAIFGDGSDVGEVLYCDENHVANASASDKAMTIKGCEEADTIIGSNYNDYILGNGGADSIIGGAGDDTYVFNAWGDAQATIADTAGDNDKLQINTAEYSSLTPYFEVTLTKDGDNYVVVDGEVQFTTSDLYINKDSNYTFENAKTYDGIKVENFFTTGRIETIQNTSAKAIVSLSDRVLTIMQKEIADFLYRNSFDSTSDVIANGTEQQKADLANLYRPVMNYTAAQFSTTVSGTDGNDLIIVPNNLSYINVDAKGGNDIIYAPQSVNNTSAPSYGLGSGNNTLYLSDINARHIVKLGSGNDTIYGATASSAYANIYVSDSVAIHGNIGDNTLYYNGASYLLVCYKNRMWEECAFTQTDNDLIYRYGNSSIMFKNYFNLSDDDKNNFSMHAYNYSGTIVRNNNQTKLSALIELKGGLATYVTGTGSIAGTVGNDYIVGSSGNDTINSNGGNDFIYDTAGNDKYTAFVATNTMIADIAGDDDSLTFANTTNEGNLMNGQNKKIHTVFNVSKTFNSANGAFSGNVQFVDDENLALYTAKGNYTAITVKGNAIETIKTHDNYKLTSADITALAQSVAGWLSDNGYSNVDGVLSNALGKLDNNAADIAALVAKFDEANWTNFS